jgi:hypothetical protein
VHKKELSHQQSHEIQQHQSRIMASAIAESPEDEDLEILETLLPTGGNCVVKEVDGVGGGTKLVCDEGLFGSS